MRNVYNKISSQNKAEKELEASLVRKEEPPPRAASLLCPFPSSAMVAVVVLH